MTDFLASLVDPFFELGTLFVFGFGWLGILLTFYIILFRVYYHHKPTGRFPIFLWIAAVVFIVMDVAINLIIMPFLTLDLPRQWTVTERMKDYKKSGRNRKKGLHWWRYQMASNLCIILNLFDEGHC